MNYEIIELEEFSGNKTTIYSVVMAGDDYSLFDYFLQENKDEYNDEIKSIINRLEEINYHKGARDNFFRLAEGKLGDGVCALYDDPESKLRLYCIKYGSVAIILGSGGPKPPEIHAWQEDEKLKYEAETMITISKNITNRLVSGELQWTEDGYKLTGNLIFNDDDNE